MTAPKPTRKRWFGEPMTNILHLPFPPSVNDANKFTSKGKHYPSADKKAFFRDADVLCLMQKPTWFVKGPFTYHITLNREMRHPLADGDNRGKYPLDYAQKIGLIENDKLAEGGSWSWGNCEYGALLSVHPVNVASELASPNAAGQAIGTHQND